MARYDFWALGESNLSISGGEQLDGVTQGDGSHLVGHTITITSTAFELLDMKDQGDTRFDDNDSNQRLDGTQSFDGVSYSNNTVVEAEFAIILRDPNTGIEYQAVAVNMATGTPSYGTIEGISFVDAIPPSGVALEVLSASEGPGASGQPSLPEGDIAAPACFTPGTMIQTPGGERRIESLEVGDLVLSADRVAQPIRWIGVMRVDPHRLGQTNAFRPVRIKAGAFGPDTPKRDMLVSPQHRIRIQGWKAELLFGENEVLAAAVHFVNGKTVERAWDVSEVTYIHLQFDQHEIIFSDGLPTESFNPGPSCIGTIPEESRKELELLFPGVDLVSASPLPLARPALKKWEAKALRAA